MWTKTLFIFLSMEIIIASANTAKKRFIIFIINFIVINHSYFSKATCFFFYVFHKPLLMLLYILMVNSLFWLVCWPAWIFMQKKICLVCYKRNSVCWFVFGMREISFNYFAQKTRPFWLVNLCGKMKKAKQKKWKKGKKRNRDKLIIMVTHYSWPDSFNNYIATIYQHQYFLSLSVSFQNINIHISF